MFDPAATIERALNLIKAREVMRTPELAEKLDLPERQVEELLAQPATRAHLVTCGVELAGGKKVTEYRLSMVGGGALPEYKPGRPRGASVVDPLKELLREWRAPKVKTAAARQVPKAARPGSTGKDAIKASATPAEAARRSILMKVETTYVTVPAEASALLRESTAIRTINPLRQTNNDRITAAFKQHGPMRAPELHKLLGAESLSGYLSVGAITGRYAKLGGTPGRPIWGLPTQALGDRKFVDAPSRRARREPAEMPESLRPGPIAMGVPIPPKKTVYHATRVNADALRELPIGGCRVVHLSSNGLLHAIKAAGIVGKYTSRLAPGGGTRVWRTKA